jgi:hypothetical protein
MKLFHFCPLSSAKAIATEGLKQGSLTLDIKGEEAPLIWFTRDPQFSEQHWVEALGEPRSKLQCRLTIDVPAAEAHKLHYLPDQPADHVELMTLGRIRGSGLWFFATFPVPAEWVVAVDQPTPDELPQTFFKN